MQASFVQEGTAVDFTPDVNVPAGTVVVQGDLVGITKRGLPANTLGSLAVEGVFDVAKDPATVISVGVRVYWDSTANQAVTVATGNKLLGKCILMAPADTPTVRVRLSQ